MAPATANHPKVAPRGQPVWAVAELFPEQGGWTERQYLDLPAHGFVEFDAGSIEVLAAPTRTHQLILSLLYDRMKSAFRAAAGARASTVVHGPYKLRVPTGKFRTPDLLLLTPAQNAEANEEFAVAAEVVLEVVSPLDPDRDYVTKRQDFAAAGVPEYWIVDKDQRQVLVLRLEAGTYVEHGRFGPGERATSHRLPGFAVAVDDVLAAGQQR